MAAAVRMDWWRAGQLANLAILALDRGDFDEAERDSQEALRIVRQDESRPATLLPLTALARVALARGDPRRAGRLWGAVEAEDERAPRAAWRHWRAERAGPLLDAADSEFLTGVAEGRQLDVWDGVAIALREAEPSEAVSDEAGRP